ncbi:MAG: copper homeostasis protein CutC [Ferruginibacter sp.]
MLEVIAFTIESCLIAAQRGANRIELCSGPAEGGTTPSAGFIQAARAATHIALFPIIRPRGGDFHYSDAEFEAMKTDIRLCKQLGCDGVVIGLLQADGTIDETRTGILVDLAYPMEVTFHRAFDRTRDAGEALEAIIRCGCTRILTSGQRNTAVEGADLIRQLIDQANNRLIIMPGSGVRSTTLHALHAQTGATEYHSSARIAQSSTMTYVSTTMQESLQHAEVDGEEVQQMATILQSFRSTNNSVCPS